ncbi:MAG: hypothetical protein ACPICC_00485 [Candidatus Puniceispirillaceae bacterium]
MFLAIDGDILLYKAALSAEEEICWDGDIWTLFMDMAKAKEAFEVQMESIKNKLQVETSVVCLSDRHGNFRKLVDPSYKSNRRGTRKPVGYVALCDWVAETYTTMSKPLCEADDIMGILATMDANVGKCIIVSDDKDMKSISGKLYRPTMDEQLDITEQEAERHFFTQVLTGDTADGYKGVPGIGPKKAEAILGPRPHWRAVEKAFIDAGMTADDALTQARLARILRWQDWDKEKGEPILWKPN